MARSWWLKVSGKDTTRWNNKYTKNPSLASSVDADVELIKYKNLLPNKGLALDLACGKGKNSLYLASLGFDVTALDGSDTALQLLNTAAKAEGFTQKIKTLQTDLDKSELKKSHYDLIIVVRYLNRHLFADIEAALKPGGVLLYKTFNHNILANRPSFNLSYTIETAELIEGFSNMDVLLDNQSDTASEYAVVMLKKRA